MSTATVGEYQGRPVLALATDEGAQYPVNISFGVGKARLILAHVKDIEAFVKEHGKRRSQGQGYQGGGNSQRPAAGRPQGQERAATPRATAVAQQPGTGYAGPAEAPAPTFTSNRPAAQERQATGRGGRP